MSPQSIHAFAEKVALITDGASAIGRAVALQLALQGSFVVVGVSRSTEENKRALRELENLGTLASAVEIDISNAEGAKKLVGEVEKMFGRIDLLVNCLKFDPHSEFEETTAEIFDKMIDANLRAAFFVTQEALRLMKTRPKPKIVNIVSALDTDQSALNCLLAASQKAVIGLTESLARRLPENFRVNAVAVSEKEGPVENVDDELFRKKKKISEDDTARAVLFLLSSEAVGLNGQTLKVE